MAPAQVLRERRPGKGKQWMVWKTWVMSTDEWLLLLLVWPGRVVRVIAVQMVSTGKERLGASLMVSGCECQGQLLVNLVSRFCASRACKRRSRAPAKDQLSRRCRQSNVLCRYGTDIRVLVQCSGSFSNCSKLVMSEQQGRQSEQLPGINGCCPTLTCCSGLCTQLPTTMYHGLSPNINGNGGTCYSRSASHVL